MKSSTKLRVVELEIEYNALFRRPDDWALIREYFQNRIAVDGASLRRQVERLYLSFARNQDQPERVERTANLSTNIGADFTSYRARLNGKELSDNDINAILRESSDSAGVQEAWEAGKQIGPVVASRVVELAGLRNASARDMGYRDYYEQSLQLQEIDEARLFALLADLDRQTRQPFGQRKAELDARLSQKFGVETARLMPWHYANPFFQEPPPLTEVTLDPIFAGRDVVELSVVAFDRLGLVVRDVLERSDLYERPAKNQHAFSIHVDTMTDDVRILCNVRPDEYSATTMLHELGHAVYDKYLAPELPYLLRSPAHTNSTEGIAMLMGRLTRNREWLESLLGAAPRDVEELVIAAQRDQRFQMLTLVRWILVMTHFERALYENPQRDDLNDLWWKLVSRFQMLNVPESRGFGEAPPDWAAKIHLALYPVYYHNYMLGELTASQIQETLGREAGGRPWFHQKSSGDYLRTRMFHLGAKYPWNQTVERVTGEPLTSGYFVQQFVDVA